MIKFHKMCGIYIGDHSGEVFAKTDLIEKTCVFVAKVNNKTVAEGLIFEDVRNSLIEIFCPKKGIVH